MLFDTHAHLDDEAFDLDRKELLEQIRNSDVKRYVNVAASIESSRSSVELAKKYDFIYASVGIHPHDVSETTYDDIDIIRNLSKEDKVVAIGEIGLDYYYDFSPKDKQKKWFIEQIKLSEELNLPYIVHSRDASEDTLKIIREYTKHSKFVLHCYSQSSDMVEQYTSIGGYISFAGPVTFKNATNLRKAVEKVPLDRLLIETDSPYLTPVPNRGKRNNPMYVKNIAETIAEIRKMSYEEICKITFENANAFFKL